MSAHLQTVHRIVGGGTASLSLDLGRITSVNAHSFGDDRMVEIHFQHANIRMHRAEFADLLMRGDAVDGDLDYFSSCNCSGATADLEGRDV